MKWCSTTRVLRRRCTLLALLTHSMSRTHGSVTLSTSLHVLAIHAWSLVVVDVSLLRLFSSVVVHVLEVEGVDMARYVA